MLLHLLMVLILVGCSMHARLGVELRAFPFEGPFGKRVRSTCKTRFKRDSVGSTTYFTFILIRVYGSL